MAADIATATVWESGRVAKTLDEAKALVGVALTKLGVPDGMMTTTDWNPVVPGREAEYQWMKAAVGKYCLYVTVRNDGRVSADGFQDARNLKDAVSILKNLTPDIEICCFNDIDKVQRMINALARENFTPQGNQINKVGSLPIYSITLPGYQMPDFRNWQNANQRHWKQLMEIEESFPMTTRTRFYIIEPQRSDDDLPIVWSGTAPEIVQLVNLTIPAISDESRCKTLDDAIWRIRNKQSANQKEMDREKPFGSSITEGAWTEGSVVRALFTGEGMVAERAGCFRAALCNALRRQGAVNEIGLTSEGRALVLNIWREETVAGNPIADYQVQDWRNDRAVHAINAAAAGDAIAMQEVRSNSRFAASLGPLLKELESKMGDQENQKEQQHGVTKFQVKNNNGLIGSPHDTLVDAVLEAAGHDGFHACFERMDDNGNISPDNPMRLFSGRVHIGNNPYYPSPEDAFGPESRLTDDDVAMAEVADEVYRHGVLHSKYNQPRNAIEICQLSYLDGRLTHVDGVALEEHAENSDSSVDSVREYWGGDLLKIEEKSSPKLLVLCIEETGNAAFVDTGRDQEVARIMDSAAKKISKLSDIEDADFPLHDLNGNRVGRVWTTSDIGEGAGGPPENTVRLAIETGNAAFEKNACSEVCRILHEAAAKMRDGEHVFAMRDVNGNLVGKCEFREPLSLMQDGVIDMEKVLLDGRVYLAEDGYDCIADGEFRFVVTEQDFEPGYGQGQGQVWLVNAKGELASGYEEPQTVRENMFRELKRDEYSDLLAVAEGRKSFDEFERRFGSDDAELS